VFVLVGTSVWIDHFRNGNAALADLLARDIALTHPMIGLAADWWACRFWHPHSLRRARHGGRWTGGLPHWQRALAPRMGRVYIRLC
jgi:hypothetical protein